MTTNDLVTDILNEAKDKIHKDYISLGLKASGGFGESLRVDTKREGSHIIGTLYGAKQAYWMEHGRQPNKKKTKGAVVFLGKILEKWVQDKGINVNPYAAAYKIVHEGIQVPNRYNKGGVISNTINDKWRDETIRRIASSEAVNIKSDIIKKWQQ